jgi:hypothetical protein
MKSVARASILERIVDERVGLTVVGAVSTTIDKIAEEIARETMQDEAFRRSLRELVHKRSEALLEQLIDRPRRKSRRRVAKR